MSLFFDEYKIMKSAGYEKKKKRKTRGEKEDNSHPTRSTMHALLNYFLKQFEKHLSLSFHSLQNPRIA